MDSQQKAPQESRQIHQSLFSRFLLVCSLVGLILGLFEAALLWNSPRIIVLLHPDIRYVIWFLAPLVDMGCFTLLGLLLGGLAARKPGTTKTAILVAVAASFVVAFVSLRFHWLHSRVGLRDFGLGEGVTAPLVLLAMGFLVSFVVVAALWGRLVIFAERHPVKLRRPVAWGIGVAGLVSVVGVGVFQARISSPAAHVHAEPASQSQGPNVVLITLDTVRADHLSAYGYARPTTPYLDRFARRGVLFENAIAAASWTLASHSSIFTGLLPHQHGADWPVPLAKYPWTLAEVLSARGYETAGFSANLHYGQSGWGIAQGFQTYHDDSTTLRHNLVETLVGTALIQPFYQEVVRYDFFDRRNAKELDEDVFRWFRHRSRRPFFLFINYFDCHEPYMAPSPYNRRFGYASGSLLARLHALVSDDDKSIKFSPAERTSLIAAYDNSLAYLDEQVGLLLEFLRQSPAGQNTIVIITSDHGEAFGEHVHYCHGFDLYRQVLHVPLMIEGPGIPQDLKIDHLVTTRQLFSTVLDLVGGGKTPFARRSLARFWSPSFMPTPFDDAVVSELDPIFQEGEGESDMSLTTPEWQYIDDPGGRQELYHWSTDPGEQKDLAALPDEQKTLENLHNRLVRRVENSVGPWLGADYLIPLGYERAFLHDLELPQPLPAAANTNQPRVGTSQAYFDSGQSWSQPRPTPAQRELMESLPYH